MKRIKNELLINIIRPVYIKNFRYNVHYNENDWGHSIWIMGHDGISFCRVYWYSDDETTVYLDSLSVTPSERKKGIGTELQEIREEIGITIGAKYSCLSSKKDTWQHEWYKRRGYIDFQNRDDVPNTVWMKKELI